MRAEFLPFIPGAFATCSGVSGLMGRDPFVGAKGPVIRSGPEGTAASPRLPGTAKPELLEGTSSSGTFEMNIFTAER